jgi:DNA-directed RNA polymerase specialized sigma24 family protein
VFVLFRCSERKWADSAIKQTSKDIAIVMSGAYSHPPSGALRVMSHEQEVGRTLAAQNRVLLAYVRRRLATAADAEDVAQEAIMRVLTRARETLITDPLSYAMRAARNILIDRGRRVANLQIDDLDEAAGGSGHERAAEVVPKGAGEYAPAAPRSFRAASRRRTVL